MLQSHRPLLLILLLAVAFTASALHPYGHELHADEQLECQVCLHHAASPLAGPQKPPVPEPAFRDLGPLTAEQDRFNGRSVPAPRARGPPVST